MLKYLTTSIRAVLLMVALTFSIPAASTGATSAHTQVTARTMAHTAERDGVSLDGGLIIAGIVGAVVVFAWVCSRVGDNRRPTMMT